MEKIVYCLFFNGKKKLNEQGAAQIQVEARLNKKKKYFATNVYLKPEQWDDKKKLIKKHPNATALNQMLYAYMASIEKEELSLWKRGKVVSLNAIEECLKTQRTSASFIQFCTNEINHLPLKESTRKNHLSTIALLQEYKEEVLFSDVNYSFICAFDSYLQLKDFHVNTIAKHMKHIKKYINLAINKDLMHIHQYPFRKFKIRSVDSSHTYLSPQELQVLETTRLTTRHEKLQKTLDVFLFCCYTGLRYSDFASLKPNNIVEIDGNSWLIYKSVKTEVEVRLPIYLLFKGKSLEILKKYQSNLNDFFAVKNNSNINKELIKIADAAGITTRISFHTARHTNATLLVYEGMNITSVQKILGHRNIKTTQIYSTVMDMTLVRDLEKIYNKNS